MKGEAILTFIHYIVTIYFQEHRKIWAKVGKKRKMSGYLRHLNSTKEKNPSQRIRIGYIRL